MTSITTFFALVLSLVGSAPQDGVVPIELKAGDQIVMMGDSITAGGGYVKDVEAVLTQQRADLKLPKIINAGINDEKIAASQPPEGRSTFVPATQPTTR